MVIRSKTFFAQLENDNLSFYLRLLPGLLEKQVSFPGVCVGFSEATSCFFKFKTWVRAGGRGKSTGCVVLTRRALCPERGGA